jgi:hypothetical protein
MVAFVGRRSVRPTPTAVPHHRGHSREASSGTIVTMSSTREDAHRLVDALHEQQIRQAVEVLRELAGEPEDQAVRDFAWIGMLSAEPDLADRSSEILRRELGNAE